MEGKCVWLVEICHRGCVKTVTSFCINIINSRTWLNFIFQCRYALHDYHQLVWSPAGDIGISLFHPSMHPFHLFRQILDTYTYTYIMILICSKFSLKFKFSQFLVLSCHVMNWLTFNNLSFIWLAKTSNFVYFTCE